MLNQCQFIGNLGADPEARTFQNGGKVCNLRLAVSERWKDRDTGEKRERTEWVQVAIFGPLADVAERYLRKGSKVFISGKMQTRKWQDQSGNDRYTTEVVLQGPQAALQMLDSPGQRQDEKKEPSRESGQGYGGPAPADMDDEIPFAPEWRI